ncbi:antibiotic biosynthesis monooxygenase family protein [Chloroflexota bacterium]
MYAAITDLKLKPEHFDRVSTAAKNAPERFKEQKGFVRAIYYSNKEKNDFGSITVWETKEDFESYWDSISVEEKERVNSLLMEPLTQSINEVIVDFALE